MFDHIVVPLDGSQIAECVLPHALALARACDSRITVLRIMERSDPDRAQTLDPVQWHIRKAEAEAYLGSVVDRIRGQGLEAEAVTLEGDAHGRILEYTRSSGAGLVILSSHGSSGLTGWNISGGVQKIISRAHTSIMVVRAYQPAQADPDFRYGRIMIPLDGSQRAECVFPLMMALSRGGQPTIIIPHVVSRPQMPRQVPPAQIDLELSEKITERNREEAGRYFANLQTRLPVQVEPRLIVSDTVATALHEMAEEEQVDLVLLSAHGYSGGTKWPYGSTVMNFIVYGSRALLIIQDLPQPAMTPTIGEKAAEDINRTGLETRRPVSS
jgi:nucleotide-binding universal stress UspA family protein